MTGTSTNLTYALRKFGALALIEPAGAMVDHSEFAEVIDPSGYIRTVFSTDPGEATDALQSSFAALLDSEIRAAMGEPKAS